MDLSPRMGQCCTSLASPVEISPGTNMVGTSRPPQTFPPWQLPGWEKFGTRHRQQPEIMQRKLRENRVEQAKWHHAGNLGFSQNNTVLNEHPWGPAPFLAQFLYQNAMVKEKVAPRSMAANAWPTVSSPGEDKAW